MQFSSLDEKDNEIIRLLSRNARLTYSEIGERIGLSRTAARLRVSALEESGIILGYHAAINPLEIPDMMPFVVNIETEPEHFEAAKNYFSQLDETVSLVQTTGRCHLMAICVAKDIASKRSYLNAIYQKQPGILSINAHAVLEVIKGSIMPD